MRRVVGQRTGERPRARRPVPSRAASRSRRPGAAARGGRPRPRSPTAAITASRSSSGPNSASFCSIDALQLPFCSCRRRSAAGRRRSPARSSPGRGRASAPPPRRCRARDGRRRAVPRGGPRSGCGSRRPRRERDCTKVVSERRVSLARASMVSSLTSSASVDHGEPVAGEWALREDVQPGDPVGHAHMIAIVLWGPLPRRSVCARKAIQLGSETHGRELSADLLGGLSGPGAQPAHHVLPDLHASSRSRSCSAAVDHYKLRRLGRSGEPRYVGAGGLLFAGPLLMILFRKKYPRWWFDWNRELLRFSNTGRHLSGAAQRPVPIDRRAAVACICEIAYPNVETESGSRDAAGQVAAGDPALRRAVLPHHRGVLRGDLRLVRDPVHRALSEIDLRLRRRGGAMAQPSRRPTR